MPPPHVLEDGNYIPIIKNKLELESALTTVKTTFETNLKENVNLLRVSAPSFISKQSGFNDNLNNDERPATFRPRYFQHVKLEVPFSLVKCKRWPLHYYGIETGQSLVTDMRGLRCGEDVDYTHSHYVGKWDYGRTISPEDRNVEYLQETAKAVYKSIYDTEQTIPKMYDVETVLPSDITFASTNEMIKKVP